MIACSSSNNSLTCFMLTLTVQREFAVISLKEWMHHSDINTSHTQNWKRENHEFLWVLKIRILDLCVQKTAFMSIINAGVIQLCIHVAHSSSLTPHWTNYFSGQMRQPTASKHWRKTERGFNSTRTNPPCYWFLVCDQSGQQVFACKITNLYVQRLWFLSPWLTDRHTQMLSKWPVWLAKTAWEQQRFDRNPCFTTNIWLQWTTILLPHNGCLSDLFIELCALVTAVRPHS